MRRAEGDEGGRVRGEGEWCEEGWGEGSNEGGGGVRGMV